MQQLLQVWYVKAILCVIIAVELFVIAFREFAVSFDDYMTIVIILTVFPLAYFTFHYLRLMAQHTSFYKTFQSRYSQESVEAVDNLTKSQAFKVFESKAGQPAPPSEGKQGSEEEEDQIAKVMQELSEKESEIFDEE